MTFRYVLRQGVSTEAQGTLVAGELAYCTDTQELIVGVGNGDYKVVTTLAVVDSLVVMPTPNGVHIPVLVQYPSSHEPI